MLSVVTNTASMAAARALYKNTTALQRSVERMSTGLRINRAGDDAATSAIVDKVTTEIQGLGKAIQNAQDGISMGQTIDGGLSSIMENLQRIKELFIQGSNGTLSSTEKDSVQREMNERITTIGQIASTVKFNGNVLMTNAATNKTMQTGAYLNETTTLTLVDGATANVGIAIDISQELAGGAADYGTLIEGTSSATFALDDLHLNGATVDSLSGEYTATTATMGTLADLDAMIGNISRMRGAVGAFTNALESKIDFMMQHKENVTASKSRLVDLDVASESANLMRSQILQKASIAMLSQANSMPAAALDLIP